MIVSREEIYKNLPYISVPENVAKYEDGRVIILDRREYPFRKDFVTCETYQEVAQAIVDMVTQSGGPYHAVSCGMVLAADHASGRTAAEQIRIMEDAAQILGSARPTNNSIKYMSQAMLQTAKEVITQGGDLKQAMLDAMQASYDGKYYDAYMLGRYAADLVSDGDCIMTHCWPDLCVVYAFRLAKEQGKNISALCSETRPYLQGSRITADAVRDMGIPVTVMCDNMVGYAMSQGMVQVFFSGTDRVTRNGYVFNKIGTFQAALCAKHFGIPYYALCHGPDPKAVTPDEVVIELRDPEESLHCRGVRTAAPGVSGLYPAFDVTPPDLVTGIVTGRGIYTPDRIEDFFEDKRQE